MEGVTFAQVAFRLYVLDGCPACQEAFQFFNRERIPGQIATSDVIIDSGIAALNKRNPGKVQFPVLVSFITKKVIYGFNQSEYQRIVDAYRASAGALAPDNAAAASEHSGEAPPISQAVAHS